MNIIRILNRLNLFARQQVQNAIDLELAYSAKEARKESYRWDNEVQIAREEWTHEDQFETYEFRSAQLAELGIQTIN